MNYQPIVESKNKFHGFEIAINGKKFKLKYQESYPGQVHERNTPDYTVEKSRDSIPIILDAKNWRDEKSDAKNKMIVYLVELSSKNPSKGILFFPNNSHLPENQDNPYFERPIEVGPNKWGLITCVLKPSESPDIQAQNRIVLEMISELLIKV